jgi:hypothetical protein
MIARAGRAGHGTTQDDGDRRRTCALPRARSATRAEWPPATSTSSSSCSRSCGSLPTAPTSRRTWAWSKAGVVIYALKVEAPGMVRFETYPGKPASLHLTAIGRALASALPDGELDRVLDGYEFTPGANCAIRSRPAFERELQRVRSRGFAFENEEEMAGVFCVAAQVRDVGTGSAVGVTALAAQLRELTLHAVSAHA